MTCQTCASGHRYWFDVSCVRCTARHYVYVMIPHEQKEFSRRIRAEWPVWKVDEFRRYVQEEREQLGERSEACKA